MNYLKTYEAFFAGADKMLSQKDNTNLFKLVGVNRAVIEDLLVDIEDKLPLVHIAIKFRGIDTIGNVKHQLNGIYVDPHVIPRLGNDNQLTKIQLYIIFYPSLNLIKSMRQGVESGNLKKTNWYDMCLGDKDIEEDLVALMNRLNKLGFTDFKVHKETQYTYIDNILYHFIVAADANGELPPYNNQVGQGFLVISAQKNLI